MRRYKSIGITGSRIGLTHMQEYWVLNFLDCNVANNLHHGDCVGADDRVAILFSQRGSYIIAHPGSSPSMRAHCVVNDLILPTSYNLLRNRRIVDSSELMLAFPPSPLEIPRSGTWYTILYAKKQYVPITVVNPDGTIA